MKKSINTIILFSLISGMILFSCNMNTPKEEKIIDWKAYNDSVKKALSDSLDRLP